MKKKGVKYDKKYNNVYSCSSYFDQLYNVRFALMVYSRGDIMKKKKPEEVAVEAVNDLFIRDIEKLLFDHKKYDIASHLMKSMGMNKKEINKIINEVKGVQSNA